MHASKSKSIVQSKAAKHKGTSVQKVIHVEHL